MSKFQLGDKVRILAPTLEGMEGLIVNVISEHPGVYRVQISGWGTLTYYGVNLEPLEGVTLEQTWDEGARYGFENYRGKLDATIDNVLVGNPYREQK